LTRYGFIFSNLIFDYPYFELKDNGNRPLHIAAQNGHTDIVRLLIRKKCLLNEKNLKGNTAIHMAIGYDYYEAAKLIMDAGGDCSITNLAGISFFVFFIQFILLQFCTDFTAERGLEGDKSLGVAALVSAKTAEEVTEAFTLCEVRRKEQANLFHFLTNLSSQQKLDHVDKASFVAAGMKAKKLLQGSWSDSLQEKFKEITAKI